MLGEYQEDGQPVREYIYLDNVPLALLHYRADSATPTITWYHTDQLGTPQALTNADGNIVWQARYSPFGTAELLVNIVTQPLRFPGQYYDGETGLHYNYFRYYDAALGRYVQADPIGVMRHYANPQRQIAALLGVPMPDSLGNSLNHLYGYVDQNPLTHIDPTGEFKGNPIRDLPKLMQCAVQLSQIDTKKLNEECQKECAEGKWGGSMSACAWNKTNQNFKKCVELTTPLK